MGMREIIDQEQTGRALQDVVQVQCFGCGALNERGLQIKSRWQGEALVCHWRPQPFHIGHPGIVYGGTIASVVDCHSIWTALATACRASGHDPERDGAPPFIFVTARLTVNYLQPAAIDAGLDLRAHVVDAGERRMTVACRVLQNGIEVANAEVVAVKLKRGA